MCHNLHKQYTQSHTHTHTQTHTEALTLAAITREKESFMCLFFSQCGGNRFYALARGVCVVAAPLSFFLTFYRFYLCQSLSLSFSLSLSSLSLSLTHSLSQTILHIPLHHGCLKSAIVPSLSSQQRASSTPVPCRPSLTSFPPNIEGN